MPRRPPLPPCPRPPAAGGAKGAARGAPAAARRAAADARRAGEGLADVARRLHREAAAHSHAAGTLQAATHALHNTSSKAAPPSPPLTTNMTLPAARHPAVSSERPPTHRHPSVNTPHLAHPVQHLPPRPPRATLTTSPTPCALPGGGGAAAAARLRRGLCALAGGVARGAARGARQPRGPRAPPRSDAPRRHGAGRGRHQHRCRGGGRKPALSLLRADRAPVPWRSHLLPRPPK